MLLYFDTSAIVKLMRDEAETPALHRFMKSEPNIYFTCDLSRTEIGRVAIRQQLDPTIVAETVGVFGVKGQNVCLARRVAGVRFGLFECRLSGCSRCR